MSDFHASPSGPLAHMHRRELLSLVFANVVVLSVVAYFSVLNREYQLDDALIYYRYFANFLDGKGLVYNPGEYFNALTSPLHAYVSLAVCGLTGSIRHPMIVLSALLLAGTIVVLLRVFLAHERKWPFVVLGGALIAGSRYSYSLFGMESWLFLLLIATCLLLYERRSMSWLGVASSLLVLTRAEGVFLVLAMVGVHLFRCRPPPRVRDLVLPVVLIASNVMFTKLYYGSFLPHTLAAKVDQGRSGLWGEWPIFFKVGYYSDRRVVDILGLVSPRNSKSLGRRCFDCWLIDYEPDYVLIHDPLWPHERGIVAYMSNGRYRRCESFFLPGYELLARDPDRPLISAPSYRKLGSHLS